MPIRRACDKCYKYKGKCSFEEHAEVCTQCERSASTCTTTRLQLRQGRRARIKTFGPEGSFHIWDIAGVESTPTCANTEQGFIERDVPRASPPATELSRMNESSTYQLPTPSLNKHFVPTMEQPFDEFSPSLMRRFYADYELFMFGPSFVPEFRAAIQHSYSCSPVFLYDILVAISRAIKWARHYTIHWDQTDIAKGTASLQKLRTAHVSDIRGAFAIFTLGQTLAAFEFLTNCASPILILRYSLSTVRSWYGELSKNPSFDPITIASIFWDTINCLLMREIPIIKYLPRDPHTVDRMAGLCTTLLPVLYDLCVASNILKNQLHSNTEIDITTFRDIEQRLLSWAPDPPYNFYGTFLSDEISGMEAQASTYRAIGLLIAHRNINPIGTLDEIACSYAGSIMLDILNYSTLVKQGTKLKNVAFPILMASLEISDISKDIWDNILLKTVAPESIIKMSALINHIWIKRNAGSTSLIFDLIDTGPDFVVYP
jgi:hypothetical protein